MLILLPFRGAPGLCRRCDCAERSRRSELVTTLTEDKPIAAPAMIGLSKPAAAKPSVILPVHWKVKEHRMQIGELAKLTDTSTKTIRFYEDSGLLPPPARTASGYRDYGPEIVDRLRFIRQGQAAGLTLQKVHQILAIHDRGEVPCGHVRHVLNTRLDEVRAQIAELVALECHLQALLDHASRGSSEHDHSAVCWILEGDPNPRTPSSGVPVSRGRGTRPAGSRDGLGR